MQLVDELGIPFARRHLLLQLPIQRPIPFAVVAQTARSVQVDATPAELTDAEVALTRAQQDFSNAIYDYLIAIARLEYTMGTAPVPR